MTNLISLAVFAVVLAVGQVLFKKVGLAMRGLPLRDGLLAVAQAPAFYAALALYGAATLLWIWILSRVRLSQAYPWVGVTMAIVSLSGWLFYGEHLAPMLWLGVALVTAGVFIIATVS